MHGTSDGSIKERGGVFSRGQQRLAVAGDAGSCCLESVGEVRALVSNLLQIRSKPDESWKEAAREDAWFRI